MKNGGERAESREGLHWDSNREVEEDGGLGFSHGGEGRGLGVGGRLARKPKLDVFERGWGEVEKERGKKRGGGGV